MNNKGLTLVELLAFIAIIGLLAVLITPGLMAIRNSVLTSTLKSKISQIENAAKDYGLEHINDLVTPVDDYPFGHAGAKMGDQRDPNCFLKTVDSLISSGYLSEKNSYYTNDDGTYDNQIINPKTGESMNNLFVCIRFDTNEPMTRQVEAFLQGINDEDLED